MATPRDPQVRCGLLSADTHASERAACEFDEGATPNETLGISADEAAAIPIRHIIIVMKENRSFDHLLGKISTEGQPEALTAPASFSNPDRHGKTVAPTKARRTCISEDPDHQWDAIHQGVAGGKMTGFVTSAADSTDSNGHFVMDYYERDQLPFYYWLADNYALSDHHFAPFPSGTYANQNFLLFGSNAGVVDTYLTFADPSTPSIFRELMDAGYTWAAYTDGNPFSGALDWDHDDPGVHGMDDFFFALKTGTLPSVAFVSGVDNVEDDHPDADLQVGEAWLRRIYVAATQSPQWDRLAIVWTYDEGGGFADHVPPPNACAASPSETQYYERGPRVPFVVISPWAKRGYVDHGVQDHTAITRFIETVFGLPALTARDANSSALLDFFDFSCGRDLRVADPPAAGAGGCRF